MHTVYVAYGVLGVTVMALALAAGPIKKFLWISEPLLAMAAGIFVGPVVLGLLDAHAWGDQERILEEIARVTLAVSLVAVAFRLPDTWVRRRWKPLAVLLLLGMPLMWLLASAFGWWILGLPVLQALLLGALVTPTDPVVASSIVTGDLAEEHVGEDLRHLVSAESGANDGLAFLLVMLPVLLLEKSTADALAHWAGVVLVGEVLGSVLGGALAGYLVARLYERVARFEHTQHTSLLAVTLAMAFALLGMAKLLHGDGILAVFAAGLAFNWVIRNEDGHEEARHERIQETMKRFFDVPVFVFFGMVVPFHDWTAAGWPLVGFAAAVLLLRRLPVLLVLAPLLDPIASRRDALFVGWFGPVAVAAMVYATWAEVKQGYGQLWTVASFVIFCSIVVHGITATPLTRLYARARRRSGEA